MPIRTRQRHTRLDEQLARGADPDSGPELSRRAAQLSSPEGRSRLANTLVDALGDARGAGLGAFRTKTRRRHEAVRASAGELLALVERLRDDEPIDARGAAMTALLVNDGASPLHGDSGQELQRAIRAARDALDATGAVTRDLATAA